MTSAHRTDRRRRLRARRAVSAFRRRRSDPAEAARDRRRHGNDRKADRPAVGSWPAARATACARSTSAHRRSAARHHSPDVDARVAVDGGAALAIHRVHARDRRFARPRSIFPRQAARAAAAPHQVPRGAVQPRTERQGKPRRLARPAGRCYGSRVPPATARAGSSSHGADSSPTEEARIIRRSERRIKEIRARLHLVTGRREDRLVFDVQSAVAELSRHARELPRVVPAKC